MQVLFVLLVLILYFYSKKGLLAIFWSSWALGSFALIPTEWVGGLSVLPFTITSVLMIVDALLHHPDRFFRNTFSLLAFGFLSCFTAVVILGAAILPVLFSGRIYTFSMQSAILQSVQPNSSDFAQALYLTISFFVAVSFCAISREDRFFDKLGFALIFGSGVFVFTGLIDIIFSSIGLTSLLDVFRTANYAFLLEGEISDVRRTIGLMPEASAFGGLASFWFSLLLFSRNMFNPRIRKMCVIPLAILCGVLGVLSTSSTAYVMLAVAGMLYIFDSIFRLVRSNREARAQILRELAVLCLLLIIGLFFLAFSDRSREIISNLLDQVVFQKTNSSSFEERSSWTLAGWNAFISSYGLGVGVGSVRTSNLFANIAASTGFLGSGLFVLFLTVFYFARPRTSDKRLKELCHGAKLTTIPAFVGAALAGTTPDYGGLLAALFGIVIGLSTAGRSTASVHRSTGGSISPLRQSAAFHPRIRTRK